MKNNTRKYYFNYDFYNIKSDENLTILSNFKTLQDSLDSGCGPASVLMCMNYFNDYSFTEEEIYKKVGCSKLKGTEIANIVDFLKVNNYSIDTSVNSSKKLENMEDFRSFCITNLKKGYPIIVESVYFGGHYQVIIGYDKYDDYHDDMIIFADSSDTTDGKKDGYVYFSAWVFYSMWFDAKYLLLENREQPFIVVKGKTQVEQF